MAASRRAALLRVTPAAGAWIIAALNRVFDESGERNEDGSANIRVSLIQSIAARYNWPEVKAVLEQLVGLGYVTVLDDPEKTTSLHFGRISSAIPESI